MSVLLNETLALFEVILLGPKIKPTGLEKTSGLAPVTVMLLPILISAALVKTRFVKGDIPPTIPLKAIVPAPPTRVSD